MNKEEAMKLNFKGTLKLVVVLICLLALIGCFRPGGFRGGESSEEEPLVLKSYEVPAGYGHDVVRVINGLLVDRLEKKRYGQVVLSSNGQLLVNAPQSFHPGVQKFLSDLKHKDPLPPEPSIKVQYWIVLGMKTDGASNAGEFMEIAPALNSINETQGSHEFVLQERLSTMSQSGQAAEVNGATAMIRCDSSVSNEEVLMDLRIHSEGSRIDTMVQVPAGKLLVLGQSAHEPKRPYALLEEFELGRKTTMGKKVLFNIFYIVRADVIG
jgi:hypothetical protein